MNIGQALDDFKATVAGIIGQPLGGDQSINLGPDKREYEAMRESVSDALLSVRMSFEPSQPSIKTFHPSQFSPQPRVEGGRIRMMFTEPQAIFMARFIDETLTPLLNEALGQSEKYYRRVFDLQNHPHHRIIPINIPNDKAEAVRDAICRATHIVKSERHIHKQLQDALKLTYLAEQNGISVLLGIADIKVQGEARAQQLGESPQEEPQIHVSIELAGVPVELADELRKLGGMYVSPKDSSARMLSDGTSSEIPGKVLMFHADHRRMAGIITAVQNYRDRGTGRHA